MKGFKFMQGVIYKLHLVAFYKIVKRIYYLYEKFMIMYVPFISSLLYCVSVFMFKNKIDSEFYFYNSEMSGHSLFWLQIILSRSKNMCKWYRGAIILSMITHALNILYYHGYFEVSLYIGISFSIGIASILSWLIFRITYKTTKAIHSACKHSETE